MNVSLMPDERLDEINEYLSVIQKKDGLTFTSDAYLLSAFVSGRHRRCADLGSGTGVVALLCAQKSKADLTYAVELQAEFAELIGRNVSLNSLEGRIETINSDIREVTKETVGGELDAVFANPPYMKKGSGIPSASAKMHGARYEENGTFEDFALCASRLLRRGGSFYVVHRADRIADVLGGMRSAGIEPKRLIMIYPDRGSAPNLLLCEGKKGAGAELKIAPPLIMYTAEREYTAELSRVYENCSLDFMFKKGGVRR